MSLRERSKAFNVGLTTHNWAESTHLDCWYENQTSSTNEIAKENAFSEDVQNNAVTLYLTDHQSQGRGRGNHSWSDNGEGCYLLSTWSFEISRQPQPLLSCRIGLAVYRALASTWSFLEWSMKAPNDIFLGSKKICGLLIESLQEGHDQRLLVGLGINVFAHPGLGTSTSLLEQLPDGQLISTSDWNDFLDRLYLELTIAVQKTSTNLNELERANLLFALNKFALLPEKIKSIEADGSLVSESSRISWRDL